MRRDGARECESCSRVVTQYLSRRFRRQADADRDWQITFPRTETMTALHTEFLLARAGSEAGLMAYEHLYLSSNRNFRGLTFRTCEKILRIVYCSKMGMSFKNVPLRGSRELYTSLEMAFQTIEKQAARLATVVYVETSQTFDSCSP